MSILTPPLNTKGRYSLKQPWVSAADALYTCKAIRSFKELLEQGVDIFKVYYEPKGLSQSDYATDLNRGANIITLMSDTHPVLRVPDTYIENYPNQTSVNYHHVILSVSVGAVPEFLNLDFLKDQIKGVVSDTIGAESQVFLQIGPSTGLVTPEQHEILEVARLSAIKNRETDRAARIRLQRTNDELTERLRVLEALVVSKGLLE